ncbi:MAG TPA: nucleotide kinase domain-containing protein [Thermoleophilaceae bacterium]|jgi:hypothetical protein
MSATEPITVAGRRLTPTPVFDTYWQFAAQRQRLYLARVNREAPPWSEDPILREYRFTNVYRAADRVSQYLLRSVIYRDDAPTDAEDVVFRVLLFKLFNKIPTWQHLERELGEITWAEYDFGRYSRALDAAAARGPIYAAAYVMPPPRLGEAKKHLNHLRLLERMMRDGLPAAVEAACFPEEVYTRLKSYPSIGRFLAFQFTVDLNYSALLDGDENDFVVAGPGAQDGIRKCFGPESRGIEEEIIRYMVETQDRHFARLGLEFGGLFGRSLHLIDCQNLFCEVDKYARVAHPEVNGISGRRRIKQRFRPNGNGPRPFFPPKWELSVPPIEPSPEAESQGALWRSADEL